MISSWRLNVTNYGNFGCVLESKSEQPTYRPSDPSQINHFWPNSAGIALTRSTQHGWLRVSRSAQHDPAEPSMAPTSIKAFSQSLVVQGSLAHPAKVSPAKSFCSFFFSNFLLSVRVSDWCEQAIILVSWCIVSALGCLSESHLLVLVNLMHCRLCQLSLPSPLHSRGTQDSGRSHWIL